MQAPTLNITQAVLGVVLNVPVWAIVLYFLMRMIKRRDFVEKDFIKRLDNLNTNLVEINTKIALLEQDLSYAKLVTNTVSHLSERVGKSEDDINEAFSKIRQVDSRSKGNRDILRSRSQWTAHSFQRLISRYNEVHKSNQINLDPMPNE